MEDRPGRNLLQAEPLLALGRSLLPLDRRYYQLNNKCRAAHAADGSGHVDSVHCGLTTPMVTSGALSYDRDAAAAYIHLGRHAAAAHRAATQAGTPDGVDGFIALDWEDGHLVGTEILDASSRIHKEILDHAGEQA